jgi:hypothetical protein
VGVIVLDQQHVGSRAESRLQLGRPVLIECGPERVLGPWGDQHGVWTAIEGRRERLGAYGSQPHTGAGRLVE